jgi:hypothetical protein
MCFKPPLGDWCHLNYLSIHVKPCVCIPKEHCRVSRIHDQTHSYPDQIAPQFPSLKESPPLMLCKCVTPCCFCKQTCNPIVTELVVYREEGKKGLVAKDGDAYAKTAAPMATTRPPKEIMLAAAAPVDSGAEGLSVALPATPVEDDSSDEGVDEAETAPVPVAMVELEPTMGVTMEPPGAMGVAVGTTTTEVTEAVSVMATVV